MFIFKILDQSDGHKKNIQNQLQIIRAQPWDKSGNPLHNVCNEWISSLYLPYVWDMPV